MATVENEENGKMLPLNLGEEEQKEGEEQREKWGSHFDYLLSMVGYAVGFGNIWRFPYVCNRNGGGAFLIPFMIFLMILGFPMFCLESGLGQFSGKDTMNVWSLCPLFRGCGMGSVLVSGLYVPFYSLLLAWPIYYMYKSCSSVLPWTTCGNSWNTPLCVEDVTSNVTNISLSGNDSEVPVTELWKNKSLAHTSVEEYWQYNVLNISDGIDNIGTVQWHIVGSLFAAYVIIFLCLLKGVKSVGKVVYVTATLPYLLLIIILIRTALMPGAVDGMLFFIKPDFNKLLSLQVWLEACLQIFYSLGPGWGFLCTSSSYNKFDAPFIRDGLIICLVAEGTSIFGGFVTFSILGVMAERVNLPISEVVSSGPGLGFIAYPDALSQLPLPQLWSFLFFVMLLMVGLDSQFLNIEVVLTALMDQFPKLLRKRRAILLAVTCFIYFLFGILFCTRAGPYIFQIMDWYIGSLGIFTVCFIECVAASWFYGVRQLAEDVMMMLGRPLPKSMKILWAIITPLALLIAFILTLSQYKPPTYGKYTYPDYVIAIGWLLAVTPVLPLPIGTILMVWKRMGSGPVKEAFKSAVRPDSHWKPISAQHRDEHRDSLVKNDHSFSSNLRAIFRR